jgi:hypothetical protein
MTTRLPADLDAFFTAHADRIREELFDLQPVTCTAS